MLKSSTGCHSIDGRLNWIFASGSEAGARETQRSSNTSPTIVSPDATLLAGVLAKGPASFPLGES